MTVIEVLGTDDNGDVLAAPQKWPHDQPPPLIYLLGEKHKGAAPGPGDQILARLNKLDDGSYHATIMRRIPTRPTSFLALMDEQGHLHDTEKRRAGRIYSVADGGKVKAGPGDLVRAEIDKGRSGSGHQAHIIERLGPGDGAPGFCAMVIAQYELKDEFSEPALAQAEAAGPVDLPGRVDLRDLPLVTIDDADARDFDDAVWAEPEEDGWHLVVAIADVAWYVRPGDALDETARERGNSVYLPGRVLPMLPEALSNHWCSLKPGEDRPCMAVHLWIDGEGQALRHRFERGLMRSAARLTYDQVEMDEAPGLAPEIINNLKGAHEALKLEADRRQPLAITTSERKAVLDDEGQVRSLEIRPQLEAHRLIEAFMIAANVAAAQSLEQINLACMYRLHDGPPADKLEAFRQFLSGTGSKLPSSGQLMARHFNRILETARARDETGGELLNDMILRSQSVATYGPQRLGHFGLSLASYAHFTSPIRRYADLLVHRALIAGLELGEGGRAAGADELDEIAGALSETERSTQMAEREVLDRIAVSLLADRVGAVMEGRVSGVSRAGLFVTLAGMGADGLLPMSHLPGGRYRFDARNRLLRAGRSGSEFRMGDRLEVRIAQVSPAAGGLILDLVSSNP